MSHVESHSNWIQSPIAAEFSNQQFTSLLSIRKQKITSNLIMFDL
jgi:hypothetical protein